MFFNGNHGKVVITTPTEENCTLLVIKDSYANSLIPFLAPYYRKIVMVDPRYFYDDLEELMQVEEIQKYFICIMQIHSIQILPGACTYASEQYRFHTRQH